MKNLCKSRAKPKHYEERKAFYRSDTRQPKLLDQVRNRIRCKHYSIRTEQAYIEWIRKFIFYHGKRHPAEMGENEIVEVRVSRVREICCSHRELYFGAHSKAGGSIILYPFISGKTRYYAYDTRDMQSFWFKRTGRYPSHSPCSG